MSISPYAAFVAGIRFLILVAALLFLYGAWAIAAEIIREWRPSTRGDDDDAS